MKQIAFSNTEILEIKEYYAKELKKLEDRATEIHTILQRIKGIKTSEGKAKPTKVKAVKAKTEAPKVELPKVKTEIVKTVGRPEDLNSNRAKYEEFIVNLITKSKKMISSKEIFDAVEKEFNISANDYSKMKASVTVIISKTKANGRIKDFHPEQTSSRTKYYGLTTWFKNGKPKDVYTF